MNKIGIYSGTFDPVHVGHIEFALAAIKQLGLEKVIFLPEQNPRNKAGITDFGHRVIMLKCAIKDYDKLQVVQLPNERFTVKETLPLVQALSPLSRLVLLCGSDVVKGFANDWDGLHELLAKADVAVGLRTSDLAEHIHQIFADLKSAVVTNYTIIKTPHHHLSSTVIRSGLHTIRDLNPTVADYIVKYGLYS